MAGAVIKNCHFGFCVGVRELTDGSAEIYVMDAPLSPNYDGPALRAFMERTAVSWLEQAAPHLLATDEIVPWQ